MVRDERSSDEAQSPGDRLADLLRGTDDTGIGPNLSGRALVFDCLVATLFYGIGSVFLPIFYPEARLPDYIFVALINTPLVIRRRLPRSSFALVQGFTLAQIWSHSWIGIHDATALFSFYSLVGLTNRRVGLVGLGIELIGVASGLVTDWWTFIDTQLFGGVTAVSRTVVTVGMVGLVMAAWASGERLRYARAGLAALTDRAAQLERDREQQAQIAAAAERSRIAREMHDVIAHALSVMIAQADGAAYVVDSDSAAARQALTRISETGRDSLTQMRGLLGLLRDEGQPADVGDDPGHPGEPERAADDRPTGDVESMPGPQPGLGQLSELINQAEETGLRVTLAHQGNPAQASQMIGLTSYRLVQECLSNARRHGGEHVEITLGFRTDGVSLQVINDPPPTPDLPAAHRDDYHHAGHGLQGMRERVAAVGGQLHTEETTDTGFEVRVWLPYAPAPLISSDDDETGRHAAAPSSTRTVRR